MRITTDGGGSFSVKNVHGMGVRANLVIQKGREAQFAYMHVSRLTSNLTPGRIAIAI